MHCPSLYGQYQLKDSVAINSNTISHFQSNRLGDVLFVSDDRNLVKISSDRKTVMHPLKKIVTKIDHTLSLRTAIIYNHQELEILDDQFNPIQDKINLNTYQIFPSAITLSDSQLLWYFDPIDLRLVQWNYQLKTTISKSNMLFFKEGDTAITDLYAIKNRVYLKGQSWIYEYDLFGNFKSEIPIKNHHKHQFSGDFLYLLDDENLTKINLLTRDISSTDNFFNGKDFTMSDDQLFVIKNKGLYIYTRIKK